MGCLSEESRRLLNPHITESPFNKGQTLHKEGQLSKNLSVIKLGAVMACRRGHTGQPQPVALLGRGKSLGDYALYGQHEQTSAVALTEGRVCQVEVSDFYIAGVVDRRFHSCLQERIVEAHGQLADWSSVMRIRSKEQKVFATIALYSREQRSQVIRLPSHVVLAALLSTTRETIARSLQQLEAAGRIVRHDRWHCEVVTSEGRTVNNVVHR